MQVRGSAPVFWQQRGITAQTKITRSPELTTPAFMKHIYYMGENYCKALFLNLMSQKSHESLITESFERQMSSANLPFIRYEYFDFHEVVKGKNYEKVNGLINRLAFLNEKFAFFAQNLNNGTIIMNQNGIIRTNCLDCLDRTNVVMSKIGISVFDIQLRLMNLNTVFYGMDLVALLDTANNKTQHEFITNFKKIWADNGDVLSKHYSGTNSLISNVTRNGKGSFFGFFEHSVKSIERFYISNFEDQVKQSCIDLVTGRHSDTANGR